MDATLRKTAEIKLYTGEYCPYCRVVKRELERLELDYEAVDADVDGVLVDSSRIVRELRRRYA
jgi:glutaredoxin 3